jgi:hypothetical protein
MNVYDRAFDGRLRRAQQRERGADKLSPRQSWAVHGCYFLRFEVAT